MAPSRKSIQVEYVVDRLEATSNTWMGLTIGCARCHDHKYDPIAQKDFYRFFAFFNNVAEKGLDGRTGNADPILELPSPAQKQRQEQLKASIAAHELTLAEERVSKEQAAWEASEGAETSPIARDGLLAHYEFDGSLSDSSGHYRYGRVLHGDVTYATAAVDRGVDFDGQTQAVFGHIPAFEAGKPFSAAFWLKVNGKLKDTVFGQGDFQLWLDDFELSGVQQRVPRLYVRLGSVNLRTSERLPWPDNMNHIAVNYDGSAFHVFINGKAVATDSLKPDAVNNSAAGDDLEIDSFKGRLDDLRIYNRPLSETEIAWLGTQRTAPRHRWDASGQAVQRTKGMDPRLLPDRGRARTRSRRVG